MNRANVLDRFLDPFGAFLPPEVAQKLVDFGIVSEYLFFEEWELTITRLCSK
jgi:hypothetical protein